MFESVHVIGGGRAGAAIAARLAERGVAVAIGRPPIPESELVVLAVPDAAINEVAQEVHRGRWVAHVSGAPLSALDPHKRRFVVHPVQTLTLERGPEQLDGAWAAITAETPAARKRARWLAETLGLTPFERPMPTAPSSTRALPSAGISWSRCTGSRHGCWASRVPRRRRSCRSCAEPSRMIST